jgi:hypothetical protein
MMRHREATQTTRVQAPDVPLDADRLEPRRAAGIALFSGAMFLLSACGASLLLLAAPELLAGSAFALIGCAFGAVVLVVFGAFGWSSAKLVIVGWHEYASFIREARASYLDALDARQGLVVTDTQSETTITVDDPVRVLALLVEIHRREMSGDVSAHTVRGLRDTGGYLTFARGQQRRVGTVSDTQARAIADWLYQHRLTADSTTHNHRYWTAKTYDDVLAAYFKSSW